MWRFHLESQKSPNEVKMASGCEWEWVAKCNEKLHTECLFRLFKEKKRATGQRSSVPEKEQWLTRAIGGKCSTIIIKPRKHKRIGCPYKSKENEPRPCYEAPCEWTTLSECLDAMLWSQARVSSAGALQSRSRLLVLEWRVYESMVVMLYVNACKLDSPSGGW